MQQERRHVFGVQLAGGLRDGRGEIRGAKDGDVAVDDGLIVCFCPNGEPQRESRLGRRKYDNAWGKVHPLMVTPKFLINRSAFHGFAACTYSTPYNPDNIGCYRSDDEVIGDELCMVARRTSARCRCS